MRPLSLWEPNPHHLPLSRKWGGEQKANKKSSTIKTQTRPGYGTWKEDTWNPEPVFLLQILLGASSLWERESKGRGGQGKDDAVVALCSAVMEPPSHKLRTCVHMWERDKNLESGHVACCSQQRARQKLCKASILPKMSRCRFPKHYF